MFGNMYPNNCCSVKHKGPLRTEKVIMERNAHSFKNNGLQLICVKHAQYVACLLDIAVEETINKNEEHH